MELCMTLLLSFTKVFYPVCDWTLKKFLFKRGGGRMVHGFINSCVKLMQWTFIQKNVYPCHVWKVKKGKKLAFYFHFAIFYEAFEVQVVKNVSEPAWLSYGGSYMYKIRHFHYIGFEHWKSKKYKQQVHRGFTNSRIHILTAKMNSFEEPMINCEMTVV